MSDNENEPEVDLEEGEELEQDGGDEIVIPQLPLAEPDAPPRRVQPRRAARNAASADEDNDVDMEDADAEAPPARRRGRPRKNQAKAAPPATAKRGRAKRKRGAQDDDDEEAPAPKVAKRVQDDEVGSDEEEAGPGLVLPAPVDDENDQPAAPVTPRKRGRKPAAGAAMVDDVAEPPPEPPSDVMVKLESIVKLANEELTVARGKQKPLLQAFRAGKAEITELDALREAYEDIRDKIEGATEAVKTLYSGKLLSKTDLTLYHNMMQTFLVLQKQWALLSAELENAYDPEYPRAYGKLVIRKHSFPQTVRQNKLLSEESGLEVQLLTDSTVKFSKISPAVSVSSPLAVFSLLTAFCSASLINLSDKQPFKKMVKELAVATFPLTFLQGTRLAKVRVKVQMDVEVLLPDGQVIGKTLKTSSEVVIVITNEAQWEESEKNLIEFAAFNAGAGRTPWPVLCNVIQRHMTQEVKANQGQAFRPFMGQDFDYFHEHFFNKQDPVSIEDFQTFWAWFGHAFQIIRFQKYMNVMWQSGTLCGFMTRAAAERILENQPDGTFLLLFAEKSVGNLAIAFKSPTLHQVKHYLIGTNDINAKRSVPLFLREQNALTHILRFTHTYENGLPTFERLPKDEALGKVGLPKAPVVEDGYVDRIV